MSAASISTLEDMQSLVQSKVPESTTLEYKSAKVVDGNDIGTIVKAVSAFANSIGGQLLLGIECGKGVPEGLAGSRSGAAKLDWLYKIVQSNTSPPIESFSCRELEDNSGRYYVVSVDRSPRAPHQHSDGRYYKRRGAHSEVMEHYEVEDIRTRPKSVLSPLRIEFHVPELLAYLRLSNVDREVTITNLTVNLEANFEFDRRGVDELTKRGLRQLRPGEVRSFILDGVPLMLEKTDEPVVKVLAAYDVPGRRVVDEQALHAADLRHSVILRSPEEGTSEKLLQRLDRFQRIAENAVRALEHLAKIADGSGLRLSKRSIESLRTGLGSKLSPSEFEWDGYAILLGIGTEDALRLHDVFHTINSPQGRQQRYNELPPELRAAFEEVFDPEV